MRFELFSGDTRQVTEKLDAGLIDLALLVEPPDLERYEALELPQSDRFGVIVPLSQRLATREKLSFEDLKDEPLMCSAQAQREALPRWCGTRAAQLKVCGNVTLFYNGSVFASEGLGLMLTFAGFAECGPASGLKFIPLTPELTDQAYLIWRHLGPSPC